AAARPKPRCAPWPRTPDSRATCVTSWSARWHPRELLRADPVRRKPSPLSCPARAPARLRAGARKLGTQYPAGFMMLVSATPPVFCACLGALFAGRAAGWRAPRPLGGDDPGRWAVPPHEAKNPAPDAAFAPLSHRHKIAELPAGDPRQPWAFGFK